jgi:hypothetical protein
MKMRTAGVFTVLFFLIMMWVVTWGAGYVGSVEIIDPHEEPAKCSSCHSENPTEEDVLSGEYRLLADGIDETCHICHPYDCCIINSLKGHNHPSNVDKWDVEKFTVPETLPLFDGKITCNTCHYHRMEDVPGRNHMMVRLVEVAVEMIDWTRLCADCHTEY